MTHEWSSSRALNSPDFSSGWSVKIGWGGRHHRTSEILLPDEVCGGGENDSEPTKGLLIGIFVGMAVAKILIDDLPICLTVRETCLSGGSGLEAIVIPIKDPGMVPFEQTRVWGAEGKMVPE